jgi:hypothetical protein
MCSLSARPEPHACADLLLQVFDAFLLGLIVRPGLGLDPRKPPPRSRRISSAGVEYRHLQPNSSPEFRNRLLFQQMPPQVGDLLFGSSLLLVVASVVFSRVLSPLS